MSALFTLLFLGALGTGIYYLAKHVGFIEYYKKHVLNKTEKGTGTGCKCSPSDTALKFKEINLMLESINTSINDLKSEQISLADEFCYLREEYKRDVRAHSDQLDKLDRDHRDLEDDVSENADRIEKLQELSDKVEHVHKSNAITLKGISDLKVSHTGLAKKVNTLFMDVDTISSENEESYEDYKVKLNKAEEKFSGALKQLGESNMICMQSVSDLHLFYTALAKKVGRLLGASNDPIVCSTTEVTPPPTEHTPEPGPSQP